MRRIAILAFVALASAAPAAAATLPSSHGQLLRLAPFHGTANATQSSNWIGYDQGSLEQGGKLFGSVTGEWTVPRAKQHASGQAASSSDWIGIGGGCVDAGCALTDQTLIQTGTEQDVASNGTASYSAWWEAIPSPSVTITSISVDPGDRMYASIAEAFPASNLWTITLKDLSNGQSFTTTVPYVSTQGSAEWIEENPLIIGTAGSGFSTLPDLTSPVFDHATVNGSPVKLAGAEQMELVDSNGKVIGVPSAPDAEADGFNACAWASACAAPGPARAVTPTTGGPVTRKPTAKRRARRRHTTARIHRRRRRPARRRRPRRARRGSKSRRPG